VLKVQADMAMSVDAADRYAIYSVLNQKPRKAEQGSAVVEQLTCGGRSFREPNRRSLIPENHIQ